MKNILQKTIKTTEKTMLIVFILLAFGAIGTFGEDFTLQFIQTTLLYSIVLGIAIGLSLVIFDIDKLSLRMKFIIHFTLSFIIMNVAEGLVFQGTLLPNSEPLAYLIKFLIFLVSYIIVTLISRQNERNIAIKLNDRIKNIQLKNKA